MDRPVPRFPVERVSPAAVFVPWTSALLKVRKEVTRTSMRFRLHHVLEPGMQNPSHSGHPRSETEAAPRKDVCGRRQGLRKNHRRNGHGSQSLVTVIQRLCAPAYRTRKVGLMIPGSFTVALKPLNESVQHLLDLSQRNLLHVRLEPFARPSRCLITLKASTFLESRESPHDCLQLLHLLMPMKAHQFRRDRSRDSPERRGQEAEAEGQASEQNRRLSRTICDPDKSPTEDFPRGSSPFRRRSTGRQAGHVLRCQNCDDENISSPEMNASSSLSSALSSRRSSRRRLPCWERIPRHPQGTLVGTAGKVRQHSFRPQSCLWRCRTHLPPEAACLQRQVLASPRTSSAETRGNPAQS